MVTGFLASHLYGSSVVFTIDHYLNCINDPLLTTFLYVTAYDDHTRRKLSAVRRKLGEQMSGSIRVVPSSFYLTSSGKRRFMPSLEGRSPHQLPGLVSFFFKTLVSLLVN